MGMEHALEEKNQQKNMCMCVLQIEQVSQLSALVQAQLEYHSRASEILQQLSRKMEDRYRSSLLLRIEIKI